MQKETLVLWVCLAELNTSGDDRQAGNNPQGEVLEVKSNQMIRIAGLLKKGFFYTKRLTNSRCSIYSH